ncbi:MAG: outer membrane lipid asymmetry maintenance protein MlaD [Gammaproteobacteria bacterium]|nr:outer membrane lipid asymmetry maintenance protein MlaD [Gammaproteobacteria bacterium]CAJ2377415.1 MAG: intermembrane phospholipid transport system, substrate binding protein MlaD [Arenicellales bacterium IbO2]MDA7962603.1 outer membrane lipid asymmetry maintenance protein MlaD [Gammaproteobacteria bacterium]MDA7970138.1 outer membrane lipid asymmetry maintenance protein MlaD [Gammaproteobacteria bacterium]MDA7972269.1 outer membrane lipid asymmetry maintenance protein MlaD [Gammaproteobact
MQRTSTEIWVGIFILLGLAALTMLAVQVSNAGGGGGNTFRVTAHFSNVGGLNEKAPVMIGGVRVGRVGDITIDRESYEAVVGMDIDARYDNLPADTSAAILTAGLLGAQFIGLLPGADDFYLEEGDRVEITQSAIQLESLISQFMFSQGEGKEQ